MEVRISPYSVWCTVAKVCAYRHAYQHRLHRGHPALPCLKRSRLGVVGRTLDYEVARITKDVAMRRPNYDVLSMMILRSEDPLCLLGFQAGCSQDAADAKTKVISILFYIEVLRDRQGFP